MAFASQFSLSMELTRLLPLRSATDKATEAVLNFARNLRVSEIRAVKRNQSDHAKNTGSDIVVEADLAEFFGRCRIARNMESSFRSVVSAPGTLFDLCHGLVWIAPLVPR